ncbi:hypothetical protein [Paenibacillus tyrfis]|uniref:hypothetical protein n=1 Tax=Paenibacillus tyrfis TaxID=1501230 RepID=UPI00209C7B1D|nr:hypothetical protein [Paenibacillus tyrfis]MCP1306476.1 hypothetical protein [Paenibacillus tyrfis]
MKEVQYSTNYNFKKPDRLIDNYDIRDQNENWDAADTELKKVNDKLAATPTKTTTPLKLYVNGSTGNDANDGKTAATAFKTIQKAVNSLPQVINHVCEIIIAAGTYNEEVTISGFSGGSALWIKGTDSTSYYTARAFAFDGVTVRTHFDTAEANGKHSVFGCAFYIRGCTSLQMSAPKSVTVDTSYDGIYVEKSTAFIYSAVISSKRSAIVADYASKVHVGFCSGTGNVYGIQCAHGASMGIEGSQPSGTTNRLVLAGGSLDDGVLSATSGNITLYVSPSGNDGNDGLTAGTALRSIQTAINRIPQIVNHTVTIVVAAGTYSEDVVLSGFMGRGQIIINGDTVVSDSRQLLSIGVYSTSCGVWLQGLRLNSISRKCIEVSSAVHVDIQRMRMVTNAPYEGVYVVASSVHVGFCEISNRSAAIFSRRARVYSDSNTGANNTYGLVADTAGTIGKNGSQPAGATLENQYAGGVIRA